jgi:hypothetical protein
VLDNFAGIATNDGALASGVPMGCV